MGTNIVTLTQKLYPITLWAVMRSKTFLSFALFFVTKLFYKLWWLKTFLSFAVVFVTKLFYKLWWLTPKLNHVFIMMDVSGKSRTYIPEGLTKT